MIRGIRTLKLILMSWLLPIIVLFAAAFLISLPFKGMDILWKTHHTSQIMLGAAAWLISLINAAYQDGAPEHTPPKILRYAGIFGAVLVLPLTAIAVCAIGVRAAEFGWTVNLVEVAACSFISGCYAIGYLMAAVPVGPWLKRLEKTNIYTAFAILAVLLALYTPVADPARLAVASQMQRLDSGAISVDKLDLAYLRRSGERYGAAAIRNLKNRTSDPAMLTKIDDALKPGPAPFVPGTPPVPPTPQDLSANITVHPANHNLPDSFLQQDWQTEKNPQGLPLCLHNKVAKCDAVLIDASPLGAARILIVGAIGAFNIDVFTQSATGWILSGSFSDACKNAREDVLAGNVQFTAAGGEDVVVNGHRFHVNGRKGCDDDAGSH
jgi:hypothetical protein